MERTRTALDLLVAALNEERQAPEAITAGELDPLLKMALAAGIMSEGQARDVDAFADGIVARGRAGEITDEQAHELTLRQAELDGHAFNAARARNRAARRAAAAQQRKSRR